MVTTTGSMACPPSGFAVDNWTETAKHSRRREGLPRAQFDYLTLLFKHVRIPEVS